MIIGILGIKTYPALAGADRVVENILANVNDNNTYYLYLTTVDNKIRLNSKGNVNFIYIPTVRFKNFKALIFFLISTIHVLIKGNYDLVHIHNSDFGLFNCLLRLKRKLKIISTFHGNPYEREKWGIVAKIYFHIAEKCFIKFSDSLTTVAESKINQIKLKDEKQLKYIPNGIVQSPSVNSLEYKKLGIKTHGYIFFACGRVDRTKGLHDLIQAYNNATFKEILLIVGDFSHDVKYSKYIFRLSEGNTNIRIIDTLFPKEELYGILKNARVFVFPSRIEAMSMMLLEAIMMKTPVICSDINENISVVGNDYKYLFRNQDIDHLQKKLTDFLFDNNVQELTEKLYDKIIAQFNWKIITQQYEKLYQETLFNNSIKISLPFKINNENAVIENLWKKVKPTFTLKYKLYYHLVRPIFPIKTRRIFQGVVTKSIKYDKNFIDGNLIKLFKENDNYCETVKTLYPNHFQSAVILTHDLDDMEGFMQVPKIIELEEKYGFKSCWFIVPYKYKIDEGIVKLIRDAGHEIGIHGFNHDGKSYSSKKLFDKRLPLINSAIERYGAVGFRSPMVHRNLEWQQKLNIKYEASSFDYDPFQPFPNHTQMIWPFIVGKFVELPYTIPQDHTLFHIFKKKDISIWRNKIKWLVDNNGMVLTLTHPEYFQDNNITNLYIELLSYLNEIKDAWRCLPKEMADWWLKKENLETQMKV